MKTPWRFVADLVSRKPKAERAEARSSDREEIKALAYTPAGEEPVREIDATPTELTNTGEAERDPELQVGTPPEIDATAISQEATPSTLPVARDAIATTLSADNGIAATTTKTLRAAKEPSVPASPATANVSDVAETPATSEGPKTFVEEMAALDLEVLSLRRQLATKLSEQNAQLRKMLAHLEKR